MFTKTAFALTFAFATISAALGATKSQTIVPSQNIYNPRGAYVGTDPGGTFALNRTRSGRGY